MHMSMSILLLFIYSLFLLFARVYLFVSREHLSPYLSLWLAPIFPANIRHALLLANNQFFTQAFGSIISRDHCTFHSRCVAAHHITSLE